MRALPYPPDTAKIFSVFCRYEASDPLEYAVDRTDNKVTLYGRWSDGWRVVDDGKTKSNPLDVWLTGSLPSIKIFAGDDYENLCEWP